MMHQTFMIARRPGSSEEGFTLIEIMIVVLILGMASGYAMVNYSGFTEEQRLDSTVRRFVGIYGEMRAYAAKERREVWLEFDIHHGEYRTLVYPIRDELGNYIDAEGNILDRFDVDERVARSRWLRLEDGVVIQDIQGPGPNGTETFEINYWMKFPQDGTLPPHIIHFTTVKNGLEVSLEVEGISGTVTVRDGYKPFDSPEEEDFDNLSEVVGEDDGF